MLWVVLITCSASINGVYSAMPVDLPMDIEDGNWLIRTSLTSNFKEFASQTKIEEYIKSVNGTVRGKIVATVGTESPVSIYYSNANQYERLHVTETICTNILYSRGWNRYINGLADDLINHLILVGPSIFFRINNLNPVWSAGEDDVIRGVKLHSAKTNLESYLKVQSYYKGKSLEGLNRPTRILFSGYDPYSKYTTEDQYLLDYYTVALVDQNFDAVVTPEAGLFCEKYLKYPSHDATTVFPKLNHHKIHFIAETRSFNAGPSKKEEVYADERYQILRIKSSISNMNNKYTSTESIYDYQLGIKYEFTENKTCSVFPMDLTTSPGIVQDSSLVYGNYKLDLNRLLDFDFDYRYLGPTLFNNRDEIGIHAWEKYDKTMKFGDENLTNVITTQYFSRLKNKQAGYTLVGTTMKAHGNDRKLIATVTKSYFDYGHEISPSVSMEKFSVEDCYSDPKAKKTIAFHFACPDNHCDHFNQHYYQIQDEIARALINTGTISATRITSIVPIIDSKEIIVYVTILDFPNIKDAFIKKNMKLAKKTLTTESNIIDGDEEACLRSNSYKYEPFVSIAFCKTEDGNVCQRIDNNKVKLVEDKDNGASCSVFMTPLKNLYRYSRESPLDNIHEKFTHIEITLLSSDNKSFKFISSQVTDVSKPADEYNPVYETIIRNTKLIDNKLDTIKAVDTINLRSCHRKCVQSTENDCRSFSFCTYAGQVECFLSTVSSISPEKISADPECNTYTIDSLKKYMKISSKKYTDNDKSVSLESSLGKCASFCFDSDSCKSFQYCSGSCSLSGYYTDESSIYSESCDIYIPNVLSRFELIGKFVVEDVFHIEINLNPEQCAALCYYWNDNNVICESFNFCPTHGKTPNLCYLSKYSNRDTNHKLVSSDVCQSYERNNPQDNEQKNTRAVLESTHDGSIYWIITLFVTTGLISGIIVSLVYSKIFSNKNKSSGIYNRNTFSWTKQLNDGRESVNLGETLQISSDYAIPSS